MVGAGLVALKFGEIEQLLGNGYADQARPINVVAVES
jgi:hypothetical protein